MECAPRGVRRSPPAGWAGGLPAQAEEVLFQLFSPSERLGNLSLVCWAWHDACHSAALIERVSLDIHVHGQHDMAQLQATEMVAKQRLRSLAEWLTQHAANVRRLKLSLELPEMEYHAWDNSYVDIFARLLGRCLTACAEEGSLERLTLGWTITNQAYRDDVTMDLRVELEQLTTLSRLKLHGNVLAAPDLSTMERLRCLQLCNVGSEDPVALPYWLSSLAFGLTARAPRCNIGGEYVHPLPELRPFENWEIHRLAGLRILELGSMHFAQEPWPDDAFNCLSALQNLHLLRVAGHLGGLPLGLCDVLPTLRKLRTLQLVSLGQSPLPGYHEDPEVISLKRSWATLSKRLWPAIGRMTQLTGLALHRLGAFLMPCYPPQLTALTNLRSLQLGWLEEDDGTPEGPLWGGDLGAAGWLAGLTQLTLDFPTLIGNLHLLSDAGLHHLQCLRVVCTDPLQLDFNRGTRRTWEWVWEVAASRPSLRRLLIVQGYSEDGLAPADIGWEAGSPSGGTEGYSSQEESSGAEELGSERTSTGPSSSSAGHAGPSASPGRGAGSFDEEASTDGSDDTSEAESEDPPPPDWSIPPCAGFMQLMRAAVQARPLLTAELLPHGQNAVAEHLADMLHECERECQQADAAEERAAAALLQDVRHGSGGGQ